MAILARVHCQFLKASERAEVCVSLHSKRGCLRERERVSEREIEKDTEKLSEQMNGGYVV